MINIDYDVIVMKLKLILSNKFPRKRISQIYHILIINRMTPFSNWFMEWPSYIRLVSTVCLCVTERFYISLRLLAGASHILKSVMATDRWEVGVGSEAQWCTVTVGPNPGHNPPWTKSPSDIIPAAILHHRSNSDLTNSTLVYPNLCLKNTESRTVWLHSSPSWVFLRAVSNNAGIL